MLHFYHEQRRNKMYSTKEALNLSEKQVEKVIRDFMEHLSVAEIGFFDKIDKEEFGEGFILENYMATLK
jgi:hypothetical protein